MGKRLYEDVQEGRVEDVRARIENGASAEEIALGLVWAAHGNKVDVARLLIEHGADPYYTPKEASKTPYAYAEERNFGEMMRLLSEAARNPRTKEPEEKWVPMGADSIAFVGTYPALGKKLSQVFNFSSRERFLISENLHTKSEGVSPATSFDDLPPQAVEKALDEFERLGGKPDRDFVLRGEGGIGKEKTLLPRGPGNV
jgi:hypothetical protein